jgi:hypothetical protein
MVNQLERASIPTMVVHVGERGADLFPFFHVCQAAHTHFLVRGFENRRLQLREDAQGQVFDAVRNWPTQAHRPSQVPASHRRIARSTVVHLAFAPLTVLPPRFEKRCGKEPMDLWAVRVWEKETPDGEEPLEWIVLTSVPTSTLSQAWEHVHWYEHRWVVEDSHQGLKTGCHLEQRQGQRVDRFKRLLGFLSPRAVRLLQLRDLARREPDRPACEVLDTDVLAIVATHTNFPHGCKQPHNYDFLYGTECQKCPRR